METTRVAVVSRAARRAATAAAFVGLAATTVVLEGPVTAAEASGAAHVERARGHAWPGHPGRRIVRYTVRPGDTATGIAVRFHAWTKELLRLNHKRRTSVWYVGERVRVPVVVARARPHAQRPRHHAHHHVRHVGRARVRDEVARVARQHGVRPKLALAIAWQESGWRQHVRSSAGAIGAMQVMPGTGRWISGLLGHRLHLRRLHDNVVAGVTLFDLLRRDHGVRRSLAAYYQGLGSLHAHGRYPSTKRYVRSVMAHWRALRHGWRPLA